MVGIGSGELILILIIAILVVGPEQMVKFSAQIGRLIARLRAETNDVTREFRDAFDLEIGDLDLRKSLNGSPARPDFKAPSREQAAGAAGRVATASTATPAGAPATGPANDAVAPGAAPETAATPEGAAAAEQAPEHPAAPAWTGPLAAQNKSAKAVSAGISEEEALAAEAVDIAVGEMVYEDEEVPAVELDGPTLVSVDEDDATSGSEEETA
jgi:sec-independent protein translocase protein TatB